MQYKRRADATRRIECIASSLACLPPIGLDHTNMHKRDWGEGGRGVGPGREGGWGRESFGGSSFKLVAMEREFAGSMEASKELPKLLEAAFGNESHWVSTANDSTTRMMT
jgi:hypothetical protein